jgi:hypothetical protein
VFTDEIWLEMDARPRIKLFAIYQPIKIWWWHSNLAANSWHSTTEGPEMI